MAASVPQDAASGLPRTLGRYALYQELASGGIGSVCLARMRAEVGFSRIMAVKRLHPHHAKDPHFVTMFLDEARMAARVRHPNVVPVLDVVSDDDELFLVMEYVAGESLSRLLATARDRGSRVEPAIAVSIMSGVLEGLHAAHLATNERGVPLNIVHRDVSPQNVLVGVDGVARVVDFGIAKAAGRLQESTQAGQMKGKLLYMPPEQFTNSKAVDRRSDVWSASVVLWETLAGQRLFPEASDALRFQTGAGTIARPSEHGAPNVLDDVVMKGLSRELDDRFQTAREMLVAMERAVAGAPARRVGQWVQKLARDALLKRAAYVEQIEADAARASANMALTVGRSASGRPPRAAPAADETLLAAGDVGPANGAPTEPKRRRALGAWLALAVLVGGVTTATFHPAVRARLAAARASGARAGATDTPAVDAPSVPVAMPSASTARTVATDDTPVASASAPAPAPTGKRGRPHAPAARTGASAAATPSAPTVSPPKPVVTGDPLELRSRE